MAKLVDKSVIRRADKTLHKALQMSAKHSYLVILLLLIGCQQAGVGAHSVPALASQEAAGTTKAGQDKPVLPADAATDEVEVDKELKIYKSTLLEGKNEQIRIDAATVMLFDKDPAARTILLDTLKQTENTAARAAICKALSQTRVGLEPIKNKEDFIQPLLNILATDSSATAKLAAEATLIFEYEQISEQIEKLINDPSLAIETRLNALYALELHPDMRVAIALIGLLDNPEQQLSAAADKALLSMGIQAGKTSKSRKKVIDQLKREGTEGFFQNYVTRQQEQLREMGIELNQMQGLYLTTLGKWYDSISDDTAKGQFLAEYLQSPKVVVRLWSLEKVHQWRVAPGKSKFPAELRPILVALISDKDRKIRLKTAQLLSFMGELNLAEHLLRQLESEQDDEVKMALFEALGYAFVPNPTTKIPIETKKQSLGWAVKYLAEEDPKKAQKGAEIMKKLLEQDESVSSEVDEYLDLLIQRYQKENVESSLRGELLSTMAGLCAPQNIHNAQCKKRFKSLFEESLNDKTNLIREAAVEGLIYIDKTQALESLRKNLTNDPSVLIRKRLIDLAGEVGGKDDLSWLAEKIGSNAESEPAWQAMLKIFRRSETDVLSEWIDNLVSQASKTELSDEQKISFLEIAEQKAASENKAKMLKSTRVRLANLYVKTGLFERGADYLGILYETAETNEEKMAILPDLLNVYLKWSKVESASKLIENCLLEKDLEPNDVVIGTIEDYLSNPPAGTDPNTVLKALLSEIKPTPDRPKWEQQKKSWIDRIGKTSDPNKSEKLDN
jgi:HEAT repeat protein